MDSQQYVGTVKSKGVGYGFIDCFETREQFNRDVFYSRKELSDGLWACLEPAQNVIFDITTDEGTPKACNIKIRPDAVPSPTYWNTSGAVEALKAMGKAGGTQKGWGKGSKGWQKGDGWDGIGKGDGSGSPWKGKGWGWKGDGKGEGKMAGVKRWAGGDKAMLGDSDGFGKIHHQINKFQKIENPGLDPEKPSFTGKMKAHFNPHTGYTFVICPEISNIFHGKDAFLHAKTCPWIDGMRLLQNQVVEFQVEDNDGKPVIIAIVRNEEAEPTAEAAVVGV